MTLGNMRSLGVRSLAVSYDLCRHAARLDVDSCPDDVLVLAFGPLMVCTVCGIVGADAHALPGDRQQVVFEIPSHEAAGSVIGDALLVAPTRRAGARRAAGNAAGLMTDLQGATNDRESFSSHLGRSGPDRLEKSCLTALF
jgi:hypothetical protein